MYRKPEDISNAKNGLSLESQKRYNVQSQGEIALGLLNSGIYHRQKNYLQVLHFCFVRAGGGKNPIQRPQSAS